MNSISLALVACLLLCSSSAIAAFGGKPLLGPKDALRHEFAPYDLLKLNYLGMNYCENLLDMRVNVPSYTHLNYDANHMDAWHLHFADDSARLIECLAWEDEYSQVVRLELARRLTKGLIASHIPGSHASYSFRHRSGGKTFLLFEDTSESTRGNIILSTWGDFLEGLVNVGFHVKTHGETLDISQFEFTDTPEHAGRSEVARSARYWNKSPFIFKRHFANSAVNVDFTGKYWLSDDNMPLELEFASDAGDSLIINLDATPLVKDGDGCIHLPDRSVVSSIHDNCSITEPDFSYIILRKDTAWGSPGYSTALLVIWDGKPEQIRASRDDGFAKIAVEFSPSDNSLTGKVWLLPFQWVDSSDMEYIFWNAELFLSEGRLLQNGFPTQQLVNAIPTGLAAGAYILSKYRDPFAVTAVIHADNALDQIFEAQREGKSFLRRFWNVRSCSWMLKAAKLKGDGRMESKYRRRLDESMDKLFSPDVGYDGQGWASGWDHWNAVKAVWLAYEATLNEKYLNAYKRALNVFSIDEKGIYRSGKLLEAPGGFDTYAGAHALGVWGHAGMLDEVDILINLNVPNGWHSPEVPLKDLWNDAGAGPWAQDDANPEYVGLCLRGAELPKEPKYMLPVGAFPIYDESGITITNEPMVDNPHFPQSAIPVRVLQKEGYTPPDMTTISLVPGDTSENIHLICKSGDISKLGRICTGVDIPLVYEFDIQDATGVALDLDIKGDGYKIEVSPDGQRWHTALHSWSKYLTRRSVDVSYIAGSEEQIIKLHTIVAGRDSDYLHDAGCSQMLDRSRSVSDGDSFIYKLDMANVSDCWLELLLGNDYRIDLSDNGKHWTPALEPDEYAKAAGADASWLQFINASAAITDSETLYIRFSGGSGEAFDDSKGFLRRIVAYGAYDSQKLFVRISNVNTYQNHSFTLKHLTLRKWNTH